MICCYETESIPGTPSVKKHKIYFNGNTILITMLIANTEL